MSAIAVPDCPFCLDNHLLKGTILAETTDGYLVESYPQRSSYLIISKAHVEVVQDVADTWWQDFKDLFAQLPKQPASYTISLNYGAAAGQTVKHLHFWIIPRAGGLPSSGKRLARLIGEADGAAPAVE